VPFCIVFTKCDARKKGGPTPGANIKAFKADLLKEYEELPACFESSAAEGLGRAEVLNYLAQLRKLDKEQGG
jgi:GTP-binding protein